jgi:putative peptidoglycan lipid II flippase
LISSVPEPTGLPLQPPAPVARYAAVTLASSVLDRLFALAFTVLMSAAFGTSRLLDAYLLAVVGPVLIQTILGDLFYSLLLPEFMHASRSDIRSVGWNVLFWMTVGLVGATSVYAACWVAGVTGLASTTTPLLSLGLIVSPLILLGGVSSIGGTLLVARQRYTLATARVPIASLVTLIFFVGWSRISSSVTGLAFSILAGWTASALMVVIVQASEIGPPSVTMSPSRAARLMHRLAATSIAQLVAGIAAQAPVPIERLIAFPLGAGILSSMNYGRVLVSPPLLVAQSIATASYPRFVGLKVSGAEGADDALRRLIGMIMFLLVPLTVLFSVLAPPLVQLVYHRGAFDQQAATRTSMVAAILAFALIPIAVGNVLTRFLYAEQAAYQVARASVIALFGYLVLAAGLGFSIGYVGLAIASLGFFTILSAILLLESARRSPIGFRFLPAGSMARSLGAGIVTAGVAAGVELKMGSPTGFLSSMATAFVAGTLGLLAYVIAASAMRSEELTQAIAIGRRAIPRTRR